MCSNVKLNFSEYPEIIESVSLKISEDKEIKISPDDENPKGIIIQVIDNSYGGNYINSFNLTFEMAKDFYEIFYRLLKQIDSR